MNFFFGVSYENFKSELQIPIFQNRNPNKKNINLYEVFIENGKWKIIEKNKSFLNNEFYLLNDNDLNNSNIFFLASPDDLKNFNYLKLLDLNNFTNTSPDFRANLNYDTKKVISECDLITNNTNFIKITNSIIKPEIFFITKGFLGIPIYLSLKDGHLSLEHSHPPHEYILGKNKFKKVSELKKELNEIVS